MSEPFMAHDASVPGLFEEARCAALGGDPTRALKLLISAVHAMGGNAAAAPIISRALQLLTENKQRDALDELTALFSRAASVSSEEPSAFGAGTPQPPPPVTAPQPPVPFAPSAPPPGYGGVLWPEPRPAEDSDSMSWSGDNPQGVTAGPSGTGAAEGALGVSRAGGLGGDSHEATSSWTGSQAVGPQPHAPILSETGREGLMDCALQDGSSFVCGRCGGVVRATRQQQHDLYWCQTGAGGRDGD